MAGEDFDKVELQPGYRVGLLINAADEVEKIYLNRNVANPDVLFLKRNHPIWKKNCSSKAMMMKGSWFATMYLEKQLSMRRVRKRLSRPMTVNSNRNLWVVEQWLFLQVLYLTLFFRFSSF